MAIGDIIRSEGTEFEVIWDGKGEILPPRDSKAHDTWEPPVRRYNKTGNYARKPTPPHGVTPVDSSDQSLLPSGPSEDGDNA